ncbi:hypothetical protein BGW80DRAFT_1332956 [Lactifluus volemus]|nr:hypothetical protein BGW80DRAFT_1332956 [Lactifluus volemus]
MATGLSALTKLTYLRIELHYLDISETTRLPPLLTRAVLPALAEFTFLGIDEYSEELLAQIDAPQLETLTITFLAQTTSDIRQVIYHAWTLGAFNRAEVTLDYNHVNIKLQQVEGVNPPRTLELEVRHQDKERGWQVSSITQICTQALSLLSSIMELNILNGPSFRPFEFAMDDSEWLELFHLFTNVRTLLFPSVMSSLQELTRESITEVLPTLQNLYIRKYFGDDYRDEQQSI